MNSEIIKSYLVKISYGEDLVSRGAFDQAIRTATATITQFTGGMAKNFIEAGAAVTTALTGIATGLVVMGLETARTDLNLQILARRSFMSVNAFREMHTALQALGVSAEDVLSGPPELRERYATLTNDIRRMIGGSGDFETQLKKIRDIEFEFTRLKVEASMFALNLTKALSVALTGDENGLLQRLKSWNEWLIVNIPKLADEFSSYLAPALISVKQIWMELADIARVVTSEFIKFIGMLANDAQMKKGEISVRNLGMALDYTASAMERIVRSADKVINFFSRVSGGFANFAMDAAVPGGSKFLPQVWRKIFGLVAPPLPPGTATPGAETGNGPMRTDSATVVSAIVAAANAHGVDPALALAIASKESGMNPNAPHNPGDGYGMMQVLPSTFARYGSGDINNFQDNLGASMNYLKDLGQRYHGNEYQMARAYNGSGPKAEAYAQDVMGRTTQFSVTINVDTNDPHKIAQVVVNEMKKEHQRQMVQSNPLYVTG